MVASLLGVVAGLGVATGLKGLFDAFGGALPAGGLTVRPLAIVIGFAVGVLVAFVAAPAAVAEGGGDPPGRRPPGLDDRAASRHRRRAPTGAAALVAGLALGVVGTLGVTVGGAAGSARRGAPGRPAR